jgi:hypothetical protein
MRRKSEGRPERLGTGDATVGRQDNSSHKKRPRTKRGAFHRKARQSRVGLYLCVSGIVGLGALGSASLTLHDHSALSKLPITAHVPQVVLILGAVSLLGYTALFALGEVILFVLALIHLRDKDVYDRCKSLMLLWMYLFTFRYTRVLPGTFFADDAPRARELTGNGQIRRQRGRRARDGGRHRQRSRRKADPVKASDRSSPDAPSPSEQAFSRSLSEKELRRALYVLLKYVPRSIAGLEGDMKELTVDRAIVNAALRDLTGDTSDEEQSNDQDASLPGEAGATSRAAPGPEPSSGRTEGDS